MTRRRRRETGTRGNQHRNRRTAETSSSASVVGDRPFSREGCSNPFLRKTGTNTSRAVLNSRRHQQQHTAAQVRATNSGLSTAEDVANRKQLRGMSARIAHSLHAAESVDCLHPTALLCDACRARSRNQRLISELASALDAVHHILNLWADDVGVGTGKTLDPMDWQHEVERVIPQGFRRVSQLGGELDMAEEHTLHHPSMIAQPQQQQPPSPNSTFGGTAMAAGGSWPSAHDPPAPDYGQFPGFGPVHTVSTFPTAAGQNSSSMSINKYAFAPPRSCPPPPPQMAATNPTILGSVSVSGRGGDSSPWSGNDIF